jgi:hypothetical protein
MCAFVRRFQNFKKLLCRFSCDQARDASRIWLRPLASCMLAHASRKDGCVPASLTFWVSGMRCEFYKSHSLLPCPRCVCAFRSLARRILATAVFGCLLTGSALGANPVPTVVGPPVPQAVVPGSGEFTLTVYGANFVSGAVVNWNRSPRSTTFISARALQVQILASDIAKPTAGYITVTNPAPGGGNSSSSYALVEVHKPTKTISVDQPSFYHFTGSPSYSVAADFVGDGKLDLVTGTLTSQLALNRGNGDGTFQTASIINQSYFAHAGIALGDFTGDNELDLVFGLGPGTGDPPTYLKVLLGEGDGKFRGLPRFDHQGYSFPRGIVAADFDEDGKLDLATSYDGGIPGGGVFHGNGDGTFKRVWSFNRDAGGGMVGADFNGDGKLDLVAGFGTGLYLFLGNGDGTFQTPHRIVTDKRFPECGDGPSLAVNDFNGDGKADLAFCDSSGPVLRIGIALGNGDGTFQRPVYYEIPFGPGNTFPFNFTTGDFNSDGKTDIIAVTQGVGTTKFAVLWGNGNGTFQKAKKITLPKNFGGEGGIVTGDFNSDGLLDFVFENDTGLGVYIQK